MSEISKVRREIVEFTLSRKLDLDRMFHQTDCLVMNKDIYFLGQDDIVKPIYDEFHAPYCYGVIRQQQYASYDRVLAVLWNL